MTSYCPNAHMLSSLAIVVALTSLGCEDDGAPEPVSSASPTADGSERAAPGEPELYDPVRALGYSPGPSPTDQAIGRGLEALRSKPTGSQPYAQVAILFIRRARESQDPDLYRYADDCVKAALSRDDRDKLSLGLQAMILQQNHHFREARDVARRIVTIDPEDTTGHIVLGDAYLELGDYDRASQELQRALDLRPDLRSYNRGAYLRWLHDDADGATELYELAADAGSTRDPESTAFCLAELADLEWYRDRLDASMQDAGRATTLVEDYQPALRARARVLWAQDHHTDAIRVLENAIARRALVEDLLMLTDWLDAEGRAADAAATLARAKSMAREDPRSVALYYARHDLEHDEALRLAERELASRQNIYSHAAHALALARAGRARDATEAMRHATALGTPDPRLWLIDAVVKLAASDEPGARASWSRASALNPLADLVLAAELRARLGDP